MHLEKRFIMTPQAELSDKYYVCMRNTEYEYSMFVYDSKKSIWIKEDNTKAKGFARTDGALYLINENNVLQVINYEKSIQNCSR